MHVIGNCHYLLGIPAPKALALAPKALATTRHCAEGARHCAEGAGCGDSCSAPRICLEGACQRPKFSKGRLRRAFGQWGPSARLAISCATLAARAVEQTQLIHRRARQCTPVLAVALCMHARCTYYVRPVQSSCSGENRRALPCAGVRDTQVVYQGFRRGLKSGIPAQRVRKDVCMYV